MKIIIEKLIVWYAHTFKRAIIVNVDFSPPYLTLRHGGSCAHCTFDDVIISIAPGVRDLDISAPNLFRGTTRDPSQ